MAENGEWDAVGERVRQTRLMLGLSQAELAKLVGLDRTMIAKIEAGTRRIDALELTNLSSALGVPLDFVLRPLPASSLAPCQHCGRGELLSGSP
jgi:transcriptional regulator with XRE-family HTH domain